MAKTQILPLSNGGTCLILDIKSTETAGPIYWGKEISLPEGDAAPLDRKFFTPGLAPSATDTPATLSLIPQQSNGWLGTIGLQGSRHGKDFAPKFALTDVAATKTTAELCYEAREAALELKINVKITDSGLLALSAQLTNTGRDNYELSRLALALPTPAKENQILDLASRHLRERHLQTHAFTVGTHLRQNLVSRDFAGSTLHGTCTPGAAFETGSAHLIHVGYSGSVQTWAEKTSSGITYLAGGEYLYPGEVILPPGRSYTSPPLFGSWGEGLNQVAARFHGYVRGLDSHPSSPRPVTLNAWEAVYFDHSLQPLLDLVDKAAEIGVERFVLDDGWFGARRDDTKGLGDWQVSQEAWPNGLGPLVDAVTGKGMQFGLWFEPEMVNLDSDLARAHPEWILAPSRERYPVEARHQQVLNLADEGCFDYVFTAVSKVLSQYQISYVKWDYNRDILEGGARGEGRAAYRSHVQALYRLIDKLRATFPYLEIESCSSGGGRIDLGIMSRCQRVWGSDCIDPLERQAIHKGELLLLPPELIGSHVASTVSHTTGRSHSIDYRAITALFQHFGIEWDLRAATPTELERLSAWIKVYKKLRPLLHSGTTVRLDSPDSALSCRGVVKGGEGVFELTCLSTSQNAPFAPIRLPGLDAEGEYEVSLEGPAQQIFDPRSAPAWWPQWGQTVSVPAAVLSEVGVPIPTLLPESALLLKVSKKK